ncbi:MAG TPA: hypothetical protein VGQ36_08475, partial [Thermoanaerobaculia bacterium]|nr:hypothetical protein [Thermoanaerobaculia bacterium]
PVREDAEARALWLEFLRGNQGPPVPDCPKPTITSLHGGSTLSVSATGALPLSYDWFAGESGDTHSPVAGVPTQTGRYWVRVMNRCGSALSDAVTASASTPPRRRTVRH